MYSTCARANTRDARWLTIKNDGTDGFGDIVLSEEGECAVPVWDWVVGTVSGFSTARCTAADPLLPPVAGHEEGQ